jgi:hypothetical protein
VGYQPRRGIELGENPLDSFRERLETELGARFFSDEAHGEVELLAFTTGKPA